MKLGKTFFSGSLTFDEGNNFIGPNTSVLTGSLSGSVKGTFEGSFAGDTLTNISGAFDAVSASIASDRLKNTTDTLTGDLTVTGTLTAQEFHTEYVSGSIIYESGSTKFGDSSDDTHEFTGSIFLTGSLKYNTPTLRIVGTSTDGSDDQAFFFAAGGDTSDSRGAYIWGRGNEASNGGRIQINAGNTSTGDILLYTGGSVRMFISSSGTIGVGTSNPLTNLLSIRGYGAIDSNANQGILISSNHYYSTEDKYIGNGYGSIISQDTGGTYAGYIRFQQAGLNSSGAGATMTLSDSVVIDQSGNLQIATTALSGSADPRVSVYSKGYYYDGSGNGLGDFHIGDGTYGLSTGVALGGGGAGDVRIWTTGGAHKLIFGTGGGDRVYLKSNGYLGLGVYDPSHKLQVLIGAGDGTGLGLLNTSGQGLKIFTDTTAANADVYIQQGATGAAMIFRQTTSERMRIDSSGDVGIGTNAPNLSNSGTALTVNSAASANAAVEISDGGTLAGLLWGRSGTGVNVWSIPSIPLIFGTADQERMRIDSNGNVGIGTTTANALLVVSGSVTQNSNNPGIELSNSHASQTVFLLKNTTSRKYELAVGGSSNSIGNGAFYIYDGTAGDARFVLDSSGNVGIGTTSMPTLLTLDASAENQSAPSQALRINGPNQPGNSNSAQQIVWAFDYAGSARIQAFREASWGTSMQFLTNAPAEGSDSPQVRLHIDESGYVGIGTTSPSDPFHLHMTNGAIRMDAETSRNHILSRDSNDSTWRDLAISSTSGQDQLVLTTGGNVGIGVNSPDKKLEIKIDDNTDGVYFAQTIGGSRASAGYSVGIGMDPEGYGNRNKVGIVVQGHPSGWSAGKMHFLNRLDIGTSGEADLTHSRMTVDYTGNIGIGSQTPSTILDVSGGSVSRIRINSSSNNAGILFAEAGTNTWSVASVSSGDLQFFREDGTGNKMRLTSAGNLGIGTTSPSAKLHIQDSAAAAIVYQGDKRGKMIGKTIQRHTASSPKTDLFTINSFQSSNSNLYAVVTVLYVSPTSTNGGKMSAQFWIDNDNQSSPTVGSFSHEQQVGGGTFSLEWDNTNKILKFVPDSSNYWYYVVDVEYVAFDGASVTFNTGASFNET